MCAEVSKIVSSDVFWACLMCVEVPSASADFFCIST